MNNKYELLLTTTKRTLMTLSRILDAAEVYAKEKGIPESELLSAKLYPDMFDFTKQIQIATDNGRKNLARLSGKEPVAMTDTETTIADLKERISKSLAVVESFTVSDFVDADTRAITLPWFQGTHMLGKDFVDEFASANLFFHTVTAYDILRAKGVPVTKSLFIGDMSMHPTTS